MDSKLRGAILWLIVFTLGAAFQLWRGSPIDTLIYSIAALLVIVMIQDKFEIPEFGASRFGEVALILIICGGFFTIVPIHSWLTTACLLVLVPALLKVIFGKESIASQNSTKALARSSKIWFVIGSLTCLFELGNYFASEATHDDKTFPTLTVLLDPFVADSVGKVIFVAVWTAIGVGLIRVSTTQ